MGTTPTLALPYPDLSDPADVPADLKALAERLDVAVPAAAVPPPLVTALPGGAVDGQEIYYLADATNGVIWHLRYRLGSGSPYKWEFLGGPPLIARSIGRATQTFALKQLTYAAPPSPVSLTLPALAGDYDVTLESVVGQAGDYINGCLISYTVGAVVATTELDKWAVACSFGNTTSSLAKTYRQLAVAASAVLAERARCNTAGSPGMNLGDTVIIARPVRVG